MRFDASAYVATLQPRPTGIYERLDIAWRHHIILLVFELLRGPKFVFV